MTNTSEARFNQAEIDLNLDKLVARIERTDLTDPNSCWQYTGSQDGRFQLGKKRVSVRQLTYWIEVGEWQTEDEKKVTIQPSCSFDRCVNPAHMVKVVRETTCVVADCSSDVKSRNYCGTHAMRYYRHNDPLIVLHGELSPLWKGDNCGYRAMHVRVETRKGKASEYSCVDCGNQAHEWSYSRGDDKERMTEVGPISTNLDSYVARCRSCHRKLDAIGRKRPTKKSATNKQGEN